MHHQKSEQQKPGYSIIPGHGNILGAQLPGAQNCPWYHGELHFDCLSGLLAYLHVSDIARI